MPRPSLKQIDAGAHRGRRIPELGERRFYADGAPEWLFTENETNTERLGHGPEPRRRTSRTGSTTTSCTASGDAVNPAKTGTKAAAHYSITVGAGASHVIRLRLSDVAPARGAGAGAVRSDAAFDAVMADRRREADEFYADVIPSSLDADAANVMRQALAGMLWSKQFYNYDVDRWLVGARRRSVQAAGGAAARATIAGITCCNADVHLDAGQVGVPVVRRVGPRLPRARADAGRRGLRQAAARPDAPGALSPPERADSRLRVELRRRQPAGARLVDDLHLPARTGAARPRRSSSGSSARSTSCCSTSPGGSTARIAPGSNVFEGGFLGLDNIGVFDRSSPLPTGGYLEQADGTAWMALFCQNMLEIASELALEKPAYADMCLKFVEHYLWIASSMIHAGEDVGMWDEEDGFFYDVLRLPDGRAERLKVRSMVGLLPLCAVTVFEGELLKKYPELVPRLQRFLDARPELTAFIHDPGEARRAAAACSPSVLNEEKLRRVLARMLDERRVPEPVRHSLDLPVPRRASLRVPRRHAGVSGVVPAGGVGQRHVRRQLQLARADLDAGQRPDHPRAAAVLRLLRRQLHDRMSRPGPGAG